MTPPLPSAPRQVTSTKGPQPSDSAANARTRNGFALTGPSVTLDPRIHAVRPDLADIRLAGQVFAPHFAAAIPCRAIRAVGVTGGRDRKDDVAWLEAGDGFDVLEISSGLAWGIATGAGIVGYVDRGALEMNE